MREWEEVERVLYVTEREDRGVNGMVTGETEEGVWLTI